MSAKLSSDVWDVQLAYEGKTTRHWKSVAVIEGTEREAEREAVQQYNDDPAAVALMVMPADLEETVSV